MFCEALFYTRDDTIDNDVTTFYAPRTSSQRNDPFKRETEGTGTRKARKQLRAAFAPTLSSRHDCDLPPSNVLQHVCKSAYIRSKETRGGNLAKLTA